MTLPSAKRFCSRKCPECGHECNICNIGDGNYDGPVIGYEILCMSMDCDWKLKDITTLQQLQMEASK